MAAGVIDHAKVARYVRLGLGNREIAERLAQEDHVEVTPAAISMIRTRRGLERVNPRYDELLPWTVQQRHQHLYLAKMLRALGRKRAGNHLPPLAAQRLENFLARLKVEDAVVHYDGETEQGWFLVPRRQGVDLDVIRDPSKDDSGNPL